MSVHRPRLPGHLGELARRGHGGAAVRLVMEWGGRQCYIPKEPSPASPLVQVIGMAAAKVLAELVGGVNYDIPSKAWLKGDTKKDEILRRDGTTREVADLLECTERHVREVRRNGGVDPRRRRRQDTRQKTLF